jgi:hypothetical protein
MARRFGVGLGHLQYWLARTRGPKLDRVDWADQSNASRQQGRQIHVRRQRRVLAWRRELRPGELGFIGAQAIREALLSERPKGQRPSRRTLGRMLKAHGALDAVRRVRRTAPPAGWYLPDVAARDAELEAFAVIEDLPLEAGPRRDVFTTRALWGRCAGPGSVPPDAPAGSANAWKPTGGSTAVRRMPSATMIRAAKARTPIRMYWGRSSAFVCRWASPRSWPRRANTGRKSP